MVKMNSSINVLLEEAVKQEKDIEIEEEKYLKNNFVEEIGVSLPDTKCGEILFTNKHFKLSCCYCLKKFVKIKSFSKHFLKRHLNFDQNAVKIVLNEMISDEESDKKELTSFKESFDTHMDDLFDESLSLTGNIKEEDSNNESILSLKQTKNFNFDVNEDEEDQKSCEQLEDTINNVENTNKFLKNNQEICPYCSKVYKRKLDLTKHFILCKKKLKQQERQQQELEQYTDLPLNCKYNCGRTFQRKCDLSHHENHKHNPDGSIKIWVPKIKTYICETCGNCYQRKHYLIQHQRVHTGERPYSCELCPKTFTKRNNLTLHMRHHSQERKFKCQYCGKGLTDANKLRMHEMIHTGLYPFKCDICEKKFPCNSKLNVHIKKHINDRIYKCDLCDKRFLDPETLKGHAAVHSDEKPFACEICAARFPRKGALRLHMNLHNDKKKYCCKVCGMEFHQYNGIYSHYKRHGIKYSIAYEKGEVDGTVENIKENE